MQTSVGEFGEGDRSHYVPAATNGATIQPMNAFANGVLIPPVLGEGGYWRVLTQQHVFTGSGPYKVRFKVFDGGVHPCGGSALACSNCSAATGNANDQGPFFDVETTAVSEFIVDSEFSDGDDWVIVKLRDDVPPEVAEPLSVSFMMPNMVSSGNPTTVIIGSWGPDCGGWYDCDTPPVWHTNCGQCDPSPEDYYMEFDGCCRGRLLVRTMTTSFQINGKV